MATESAVRAFARPATLRGGRSVVCDRIDVRSPHVRSASPAWFGHLNPFDRRRWLGILSVEPRGLSESQGGGKGDMWNIASGVCKRPEAFLFSGRVSDT